LESAGNIGACLSNCMVLYLKILCDSLTCLLTVVRPLHKDKFGLQHIGNDAAVQKIVSLVVAMEAVNPE